jgi:CpeT protein
MQKFSSIIFSVLVFIAFACSSTKKIGMQPERALQQVMAGTYSSAKQAEKDTDYFHISLKMVPIWKDKTGTWLYVEQAMAAKPDKPYRQRVYKLEKGAGTEFLSIVYTLKNEKDCIGKWADVRWFDQFDPTAVLEERTGCAVILNKLSETTYEGSTKGNACLSSLRGATYASSVVRIEKGMILSWDQGFDASGKQVWGATKGGYVFDKVIE